MADSQVYVFTDLLTIWGTTLAHREWLLLARHIGIWSGNFIAPGSRVQIGWRASDHAPIIVVVGPHELEDTVIHEALHAADYYHDQGKTFARSTIEPCYNPASRSP
jgi:hypothetical protein